MNILVREKIESQHLAKLVERLNRLDKFNMVSDYVGASMEHSEMGDWIRVDDIAEALGLEMVWPDYKFKVKE